MDAAEAAADWGFVRARGMQKEYPTGVPCRALAKQARRANQFAIFLIAAQERSTKVIDQLGIKKGREAAYTIFQPLLVHLSA